MREILFRGWDEKNKEMVYDINLLFSNHLNECFEEYEECGLKIMQYTGLKDKNGKKIFEGDILAGNIANLVVAYEGANFIAYWFDHDYDYGKEKMWCNLVEGGKVIGNIHDNPELVEWED